MYNSFFIRGPYYLYLLLIIFYCYHPAYAQTEEEMEILQMYYKEEELVVTPTRYPKPISQVAENITVVTSKEIEEMNAHTVAEVLSRVTGVFVDFAGQDFGSTSLLRIQGSSERHVLVLIDGVALNLLSSGGAETNSIPVRIIERIEVIKGPASSSWGSSLGGVINIITKATGNSDKPRGSISASYGEKNTQDYSAEVLGKAGSVGYYLFAGHQESDGLRPSRYFDNYSLYSKSNISISKDVDLDLTLSYSEPHIGFGDIPGNDITSTGIIRTFFATASLNAAITQELSLKVSFHTFKQKFVQRNEVMGVGFYGPAGDLFLDAIYDEKTTGGSGRLVLTHGKHTVVLGSDIEHGDLDQTLNAGPFLQSIEVPATSMASPEIDRWAIYANDTILMGKWSVTPGIRYDYNSITGSFTSPSLGITYRPDEWTILRASVARGFTIPPLSTTSAGALFLDPNPSLETEKVWSYQAGVESRAIRYLWLKATIFRHDLERALVKEPFGGGPPALNDLMVNDGKIRRQGFEVETETIPFYNLSLKAGFAYVHTEPPANQRSTGIYAYNIGLRYDDKKSLRANLLGHYVWWDIEAPFRAKYNAFIWDTNLMKKIHSSEKLTAEIFITAHNIFNGSQYTLGDTKNPRRWVEGGIRVRF
jgi:vitamin B12 transporter